MRRKRLGKAYGDALVALGRSAPTWWCSTRRCPTRPMPTNSKKRIRSAFSRCSLPNSRLLGAAVGFAVLGKRGFRLDVRGLLYPRLRPDPHGGRLECHHPPSRISRRRVDRRGRPIADGARRPRYDASRVRQHGALSVRRQPDGAAHGANDRPEGNLLPPHHGEKTPILYSSVETFPIGKAKVVKQSGQDRVAIVAAGITVHEALKAYATLQSAGSACT